MDNLPIAETIDAQREFVIRSLIEDRHKTHRILFPHRHKHTDPVFHTQLLDIIYSPRPYAAMEAFRGAAKSTRLEEAAIVGALFRDYRYGIIIGNSYERACERLTAIKREIENNEAIGELFGDQKGSPWSEDQIVLANGCKIQAFGARQSLRGAKHLDQRPDLALVDDLEDEEMVATEEARRKLKRWFNGALIPALDPEGRLRMVGTPLHPKALIEEKMRDSAWDTLRVPIKFLNGDGVWVSAWPDRFSMNFISDIEANYLKDGSYVEFEQEYMCRSEDAAAKPFQVGMIKLEPQVARFLPVQIMVDPARTTKVKTSARTGYAVWSWLGSKLTVHRAFGAFHKPDEIIKTIFELDEEFSPVEIGVEADGLEEFIMQPLRSEMLKRGVSIPLSAQRAPRDKDGFISGLQPFYNAGDVVHAGNFPDLVSELLQFPTGRKDVPNALAYALRMRSGRVIYEDFTLGHIAPSLTETDRRHPRYLLVSSRPAMTAGMLVQYIDGAIRVYHDWIKESPPIEALETIAHEAIMLGGGQFTPAAPVEQFDRFTNNGLPAAAKRLGKILIQTGSAKLSQGALAPWLRKQIRGAPAFLVSDSARWTLNGLAAGYRRKLTNSGMLEDHPEDNQYRLMLESLESFVSWFGVNDQNNDNDLPKNYATTSTGQQYLTTMPGLRGRNG